MSDQHTINPNLSSTTLLLAGESSTHSIHCAANDIFQDNASPTHYKHHFNIILKLVAESLAIGNQYNDLLREEDNVREAIEQCVMGNECTLLTFVDVLQCIGKKEGTTLDKE